MKFKVGDILLRNRRKEPRTVIGYAYDGYILSDSKNGMGSIWLNKFVVETEFKNIKLDNHEKII